MNVIKKGVLVFVFVFVCYVFINFSTNVSVHASSVAHIKATVKISICGNEIIENGEDCERNNLNNQTCESFGYNSGTLKCDIACSFDFSSCNSTPTQQNHVEYQDYLSEIFTGENETKIATVQESAKDNSDFNDNNSQSLYQKNITQDKNPMPENIYTIDTFNSEIQEKPPPD